VKTLAAHAPINYGRYVEPFVGSGALFFHLAPQEAVLSDLNCEVVNLFRQVKYFPRELHEKLVLPPRDKETFLNIRKKFGKEENDIDRAASMLYLNRNCFNGLYRTNKSGKFNVPYASQRRGDYPSVEDLQHCSQLLQRAEIHTGDFFDIVSQVVRKGDFVYLDPPYVKSVGRIFNEYVKGHFNHDDTERLRELLRRIDETGAFFLLSFIEDEIISSVAEEWRQQRYFVQKNIAGFAADRRKSPELLIKNW
jgi:DNA adenine methylase